MSRYLLAAAATIAVLCGLPSKARAHIFSTDVVDIVGFNSDAYVTVMDPTGCNATISAVVANPTIATINPTLIDAVELTFTITSGTTVGTTTIQFMFIGDMMPASCNEMGMHTITVNVMDLPELSSANNDQSGDVADPINTFNGELYFDEAPDLSLRGPAPLEFKRYYASFLRRLFVVGTMGDNWRHNFEWRLSNVGNVLVVVNERGREMRYTRMGTITDPWMQTTGLDVPMQVVQTMPTRFSLLDPRDKRIYVFDVPPGASLIKLMEIINPNGQKLFLSYNTLGVLQDVSDNLGRTLTFAYDVNGHVQSVTDGLRTVSFTYAGDDLTSATNAAGGITSYQYDMASLDPALLTRKILQRGNSPMVNTFDSVGRVATQADAYGNMLAMAYDTVTRVTTVTDAEGNVFFHEHDMKGSLITATNGTGNDITVTNDATGRRDSVTTAAGGTTARTYHQLSGRVESVTDALGDTVTSSYTPRVWPGFGQTDYDLTNVDYPDGTSESYTRDGRGNILSFTDRAGHTWSVTYNAAGQPLTKTNPLGAQMTFVYDAGGRLLSRTDPAGNTTSYLENAAGRVTRVNHADGATVDSVYDALDRLVSVTDERGGTTTFAYDANGNVLTVTDAAGSTWTYGYDNNDRMVTTTDRVGATTTWAHDGNGRVVALTDENGNTLAYEYDAAGQLDAMVDATGGRWSLGYDAAGNLISKSNPLGAMQQQAHDAAGLVTTATNAAGGVTTMVRDGMNRVTQIADFRGDVTQHAFDGTGNVTAITGADGARTTMRYNELGLLEELVDPSQGSWTFAYDIGGRLLTASDPAGASTAYMYGARNRVSRATYPGGGTLNLTYDGASQLTRRLYSDGLDVTYTHDAVGRLTGTNALALAYDAEGYMVSSNGLATPRDLLGRVTSVTVAPGRTITYTYDAANLVATVTDWLGGGVTYARDAAGRTTALQRDNGVDTALGYDGDGRLTSVVDGSVTSLAIVRDGAGRVLVNDRQLPTVFTATPGEESTFGFGPGFGMTGATYDGMGRLLDDGVRTYVWDVASRLTSLADGASTVTFTYDGAGQLLSRTESGSTQTYVWNLTFGLPVVSVVERDGVDETYYVHAPDGSLLYRISAASGSRHYYHYDEAGNTLFLSNDAGAVAVSYAYDPYGSLATSDAGVDELFTWGGRWGVMREGTSGLYRMRARLYDSRAMRFLSRDASFPHLHPNNMNPYVYAAGDPVTRMDPYGLDAVPAEEPPKTTLGILADAKAPVDAFGDTVDVASSILQVEKRAEAAALLARVARATREADAATLTRDARFGAWGQANKFGKSAGMGIVEKAGIVTQVIDGALEFEKAYDATGAALEDYGAKYKRLLQRYDECRNHGKLMFKEKRMTADELARWKISCDERLREDKELIVGDYNTELKGHVFAMTVNIIGTCIPFNPVEFTSTGIEVDLPFFDKFTALDYGAGR